MAKIYRVIQIKTESVEENVRMISDLTKKRIQALSHCQTFLTVLPTRWRRQKWTGIDMGQITSLSPYVYDATRSWAVGLTNEHLTVGENDPKAGANEFERSTAIWMKRFTSAFRHRRVCTCIKNRLLAHYMCTVLQKKLWRWYSWNRNWTC